MGNEQKEVINMQPETVCKMSVNVQLLLFYLPFYWITPEKINDEENANM